MAALGSAGFSSKILVIISYKNMRLRIQIVSYIEKLVDSVILKVFVDTCNMGLVFITDSDLLHLSDDSRFLLRLLTHL